MTTFEESARRLPDSELIVIETGHWIHETRTRCVRRCDPDVPRGLTEAFGRSEQEVPL